MGSESEDLDTTAPKGSPAMLILLVVVLGPALLVGQVFGAGPASIIGGFVALFTLIASMGGALRADLRRLAVIGPLIAVSTVAPRMLAEVSVPGAIALATAAVFIGGLLPLRGRRYDAVALGLGMGTLFGYAMPINGDITAWQLGAAGGAGLLIALVLRLLLGIKDPGGAVRTTVADLLDTSDPDFGAAFDAWLSDRPTRWLGTVLMAAGRYQLARRILSRQEGPSDPDIVRKLLECSAARAEKTAEAVRSKSPTPDFTSSEQSTANPAPVPATLDALTLRAIAAVNSALDDSERALRERDETPAKIPPGLRKSLTTSTVRAGLRNGSIQVRHAARTAAAVLLALLLSTFLDTGDPFVPTLLMTTFAIVQISWRATLSKARERFLGLVVGGIIVTLVVLLLPEGLLLPFSLIALAIGLWYITARPTVGAAGIIVMSVGINTELRHIGAWDAIGEYVVLTLAALLIGGVIGFVVVPAWKPKSLEHRVEAAFAHSAAALARLGTQESRDAPDTTLDRLGEAQVLTQQLVPDHDDLGDEQSRELERLRVALKDLLATALFLVSTRARTVENSVLRSAADVLLGHEKSGRAPFDDEPLNDALLALAEEAVTQRSRLEVALAP